MICGMLLAVSTAYLAYLALEIAFARAKIAFFCWCATSMQAVPIDSDVLSVNSKLPPIFDRNWRLMGASDPLPKAPFFWLHQSIFIAYYIIADWWHPSKIMRQNKLLQQGSVPYHQLNVFDIPIKIEILGGVTHCFSVESALIWRRRADAFSPSLAAKSNLAFNAAQSRASSPSWVRIDRLGGAQPRSKNNSIPVPKRMATPLKALM